MLLVTEKLTKRYGDFTALDGLDLSVAPGEVVGLLGPNGSGKTTALRLCLGFLRPTSGKSSIGGHDSWGDSVRARAHVAYLPGELRLYENMTGRQLISFLCELSGRAIKEDLAAMARTFDIDIDRPIANLSSGMKRKIALLQMLAPRSPLVIMDEPTNALDPTMRDALLAQVEFARDRGQAVLFSSHVLAEAERVCKRVVILKNGVLVHEQDVASLRAGRLVKARFAGDAPVPPTQPGLTVRERHGHRLTLEFEGELPDLMGWLSSRDIVELSVEPLGLDPVYHRFHGAAV